MGEKSRKQKIVKTDFVNYLNNNYQDYSLIYPCNENEGILSQDIPVFNEVLSNWCRSNNTYPTVKLRLIDVWIADYNRVLKNGDVWTIKSSLIHCNLKESPQFRLNMLREFKQLAKDENKSVERLQVKGDTVFYSLSCYLSNKILQDSRISEIILSPALFDLQNRTYEPDQVVLDNNGQTFFTRELAEAFALNTASSSFLSKLIQESPFSWEDLKVG